MKAKKINEDLYQNDPTPEELVSVLRTGEAKLRLFGREEFSEWRNYAQGAYFSSPEAQTWRDLRTEKLAQAAEDIAEFLNSLGINESLNESAYSVENGNAFLNALYRKHLHSSEPITVVVQDMRKGKNINGEDVYIIKYETEDIAMDKWSKK
jgi:hypothetical protein